MKREQSNKHYLPSVLLNIALPILTPISYGGFILLVFIDYILKPSKWPLSFLAIIFIMITVFHLFIWLLIYITARYVSFFLVVHNGSLYLKKAKNILKDINIDSISYFIIETTASLEASGGLVKIELFAIDHNNSKQKLFQNDNGNNLIKSWKKYMIKLKRITKKDFQFHHYVVDIDGKKYKAEEYEKIRWKKRVPFFKSPYK